MSDGAGNFSVKDWRALHHVRLTFQFAKGRFSSVLSSLVRTRVKCLMDDVDCERRSSQASEALDPMQMDSREFGADEPSCSKVVFEVGGLRISKCRKFGNERHGTAR